MCRIWGISYAPGANEGMKPSELAVEIFPSLVDGGPDAWGYATWDGNSIQSGKYQGKADKKKAKDRMRDIDDDAMWVIGHTRAETHGSANHSYNNHPIVHGDVIGVHNGMIRNFEEVLRATGRQDEKADVDSEAIFAAVNLLGYNGLNLVEGSMVTVWVNRNKPNEIWIARSRVSDLYVAHTMQGSTVWCTEKQPLNDCCIPLNGEPERISKTGVVYRVVNGALSEPITYNPDIKETYTNGFTNSGSYGGSYSQGSYRYHGQQTTTYIPKIVPGRNPPGTLQKVKDAASRITATTNNEKFAVKAMQNLGEMGHGEEENENVVVSGITDYFDKGQQQSKQATKVLPPGNNIILD